MIRIVVKGGTNVTTTVKVSDAGDVATYKMNQDYQMLTSNQRKCTCTEMIWTYSVQCTMYSIYTDVYVQCTLYTVQCTVYNLQYLYICVCTV